MAALALTYHWNESFNKISHWFLLCTFETSWQIAASVLLSGIFETFDNYLRCGTTQMQTQPYLNIQVQIMLFAIIF